MLDSKILADNLNKFMAEHKLSCEALCNATGIGVDTIKKIKIGKNQNPTIATCVKLAEYFNISVSELIGDFDVNFVKTKVDVTKLPILSWAGTVTVPRAPAIGYCNVMGYKLSKDAFALKIDNEQYGAYRKGEILFIDPKVEPVNLSQVLVYKTGELVPDLKIMVLHEGKCYLKLLSYELNQTVLIDDSYTVLGVVMGYEKKYSS